MGSLWNRVAERLDLPPEAGNAIRVTLAGGRRLLVENHRGLLRFTPTEAEIAGAGVRVRVRGDGLLLRAMTGEMLLLSGTVFGVDME